jgi:alpha-ketoglutarate-dependent taurine dioxygenase
MNRKVRIDYVDSRFKLPISIKPLQENLDLHFWVGDNLTFLKQQLTEHGAILFRDFQIEDASKLEEIVELIIGDLEGNRDRNSPRSEVSGKILTSTDAPGYIDIMLHSESAFAHKFPLYIFFYCNVPPATGGETPLCVMTEVLKDLPKEMVEEFQKKKLMYVRRFGEKQLNWQSTFQVQDREELLSFCKESNISVEWTDSDNFIAKQIHPAILKHPITGLLSWFNQSHIFWTKETLSNDKIGELKNVFFGDETEIPEEMINTINDIFLKNKFVFKWKKNDLLILDNIKVGHGRHPFKGDRSIWAGVSGYMSR